MCAWPAGKGQARRLLLDRASVRDVSRDEGASSWYTLGQKKKKKGKNDCNWLVVIFCWVWRSWSAVSPYTRLVRLVSAYTPGQSGFSLHAWSNWFQPTRLVKLVSAYTPGQTGFSLHAGSGWFQPTRLVKMVSAYMPVKLVSACMAVLGMTNSDVPTASY